MSIVDVPLKDCFCWGNLIALKNYFFLNIYKKKRFLELDVAGSYKHLKTFEEGFVVKNCLPTLEKFQFRNFPVSQQFFQIIEKLERDFLNSLIVTHNRIESIQLFVHFKIKN